MSDRAQRDLQRLALQGDREAAVKLLREGLRAGAVPPESLRRLALLGDPVARAALPGRWPPVLRDPAELLVHLRPSADRGAVLEAVLAMGALGVEVWEERGPGDGRARAALAAARRWLAAVEAGEDEAAPAAAAREAASALEAGARAQLHTHFCNAGLAAAEPVRTIALTGGRFLLSAQTVAELLEEAGVARGRVCATILAALRARLGPRA